MARKKTTRAERRRAKIELEKGIKGLLKRIIRALRRNNTLTIISIITTILVAAVPFGYILMKDRKEVKVYIGEIELKNESNMPVVFIYPFSEVNNYELIGMLPLSFRNKTSNNVDNFWCDISCYSIEKNNLAVVEEINSILKKSVPKEYERPRFKSNKKVIGADRQAFRDLGNEEDVVRYTIPEFNSKTQFDVCEEFRIDTKNTDWEPGWNSVVKDYFPVHLAFSYRNILVPYNADISIAVGDFKNIDDFISYLDKNGIMPLLSSQIHKNPKRSFIQKKCILIVPDILYNEKTKMYTMERKGMKVYEVEYSHKKFYYDRKLIIFDGEEEKCIKLPDLSLSVPNVEKQYLDHARI